MDIDEFQKTVQPRARRSRLEPFQAQIFELRKKGYANFQVCEWLATNGVEISVEGLRKFIKSREENQIVTPGGTQHSPSSPTDQQIPATDTQASPPDNLKAKGERVANKYFGDDSLESLLNQKGKT